MSSGIKPSAYTSIAIKSPWVVPSFDKISFPPVMNNLEGFVWQLLMYVAVSGHKFFTLCKSNIGFIELKAFLVSV